MTRPTQADWERHITDEKFAEFQAVALAKYEAGQCPECDTKLEPNEFHPSTLDCHGCCDVDYLVRFERGGDNSEALHSCAEVLAGRHLRELLSGENK